MSGYIDYTRLLIEVGLGRLGVQVRDERGVMSTETAVITAVLVAIAVATSRGDPDRQDAIRSQRHTRHRLATGRLTRVRADGI